MARGGTSPPIFSTHTMSELLSPKQRWKLCYIEDTKEEDNLEKRSNTFQLCCRYTPHIHASDFSSFRRVVHNRDSQYHSCLSILHIQYT